VNRLAGACCAGNGFQSFGIAGFVDLAARRAYYCTMFPAQVYASRRSRLVASLNAKGVHRVKVLFLAHSESPRNYRDNTYPFRQDSNWLYFVGLEEPDMALLLDTDDGSSVLFGTETGIDEMIWTGSRPSLAESAAGTGIAQHAPIDALGPRLEHALRKGSTILPVPTCRADTGKKIMKLLCDAGAPGFESCTVNPEEALLGRREYREAYLELLCAIVGLREIKEAREIAELERAVTVTADMHRALLETLRPGWSEAEAGAFVAGTASRQGCPMSFPPIATIHGEILHNHPTNARCGDGDMFLLDAGAETPSGYAGDLTTSFPVGRSFSPEQADVYALLLKVFDTATGALASGRSFLDVHLSASLRLAEGLKDMGLMKGSPEDAVGEGAHSLFFPHGLGHMIGLDVHDMEGLGEDLVGYGELTRSAQFGLRSLRLAKKLKPGMVHSVEPGIYFIPGLIDAWQAERRHEAFIDYAALARFRNRGGMRIEEDWLMEEKGPRRLGPSLDRSVKAIEEARRKS